MRITGTTPVQDCVDGTSVVTYWFDRVWTPEAIRRLEDLGAVEYFTDYPRPFFRVLCPSGLRIRGVDGEDNCQVVLPRLGRNEAREEFERWLDRLS